MHDHDRLALVGFCGFTGGAEVTAHAEVIMQMPVKPANSAKNSGSLRFRNQKGTAGDSPLVVRLISIFAGARPAKHDIEVSSSLRRSPA